MYKATRRTTSKGVVRRVSFDCRLVVMRFSKPEWDGNDLAGVAINPVPYVLGAEDGAATTVWQQAMNDLVYGLNLGHDTESNVEVVVRVTFERLTCEQSTKSPALKNSTAASIKR